MSDEAGPISFERVIDATPEEAFALFTEPERLRRWQAVSAAVDLRLGGDYRLTVTPGNIAGGTYTEIDPGQRLAFTWGWSGSDDLPPGSSTIVVDFEAVGDRTLVRITHDGLTPDQAAGHSEGWTHYVERLGAAATAGDAGADPWASGGDGLDHLSAAEASWALCQRVMLALTADDRERPTPCRDFTAHQLVEHLMESLRSLGGMVGAQTPADIVAASAEDYIAQVAEPVLAAWRGHGANGQVVFFGREVPAVLPLGILSLEFFVHGWDLARAIDRPFSPSEALTAFVAEAAEEIIQPDQRGDGKGFAEIASHAGDDPISRLMAFTGRTT